MKFIFPSNSFINIFDFIKAYKPPIYNIFENKPSEKLIEKTINSTKEINTCNNKSDIKLFSHVLKNQFVFLFISVNIANGHINMKTLIIIYLNEYDNIIFIRDI